MHLLLLFLLLIATSANNAFQLGVSKGRRYHHNLLVGYGKMSMATTLRGGASDGDTGDQMSLKTAVVTGANRGLGLEMVRQLCANAKFGQIYALCRKTSDGLGDLSSGGKVVVVEGVEVAKDDVTEVLKSKFSPGGKPIKVDLLVNNAGAFGPPEGFDDMQSVFASQSLEGITMERMRWTFELNTLGPLRVTKALLPNLTLDSVADSPSKVIIITSLVGSLEDNTSGGLYGYRTAKAGVNMIGKCLSVDLKDKNVAVGLVHPGMVDTGFGNTPGQKLAKMPGQRDVESSTKGVFDAIDSITMETTGSFIHGNYGEGIKPCPW